MTDKWRDLVQRELTRPETEPASEGFYRGVWGRIKALESDSRVAARSGLLVSLGGACWKSAPILAVLVLVLSLWIWYSPPDVHPAIMESSESFVLDTQDTPTNTSLLYQIVHAAPLSDSETP